ncbi:heavy-metal-associated domain-containing protein [Georgenia yuyongxinii]
MSTTTYTVTGMTCGHCVGSVTEEVGKLAGVQKVDVDLVAGGESRVTVTTEADLALEDVRAAVDEAGYELTGASA